MAFKNLAKKMEKEKKRGEHKAFCFGPILNASRYKKKSSEGWKSKAQPKKQATGYEKYEICKEESWKKSGRIAHHTDRQIEE